MLSYKFNSYISSRTPPNRVSEFTETNAITFYAQNHVSEFPLLSPLLQTYLILPTSTSDVERGFSTMNRIKTNDRNRLGEVLVHCMLISMYGKEFKWNWEAMGNYVVTKVWQYNRP